MTTVALEKRVRALEAEVQVLKNAVPTRMVRGKDEKRVTAKKLPKWLQVSLQEIAERKVIGPFDTVEEFMADLRSPGI